MYILTRDGSGRLLDISTTAVKTNLQNYLVPYRMINDYVEINDGKVINLQIEVDLFVDKTFNSSEIKSQAITEIKNYFDVEKWQMNQNLYVSQLTDLLRDVPGVINVVDIRIFNL
jgi:phage-related baseplate assembly protein